MSIVPISKRLKRYLKCSEEQSDKEINKSLKELLGRVCKPCWELKYCPYGPLVEDFPLPPLLKCEHDEHVQYIKGCLKVVSPAKGQYGDP